MPLFVIPAKAGIQNLPAELDSPFRGNDGLRRSAPSSLALSLRRPFLTST
jgi:hypothetical protein